ncbi:hypothetical protein ACFL1G_04375 [Planctomycetota bacterium]
MGRRKVDSFRLWIVGMEWPFYGDCPGNLIKRGFLVPETLRGFLSARCMRDQQY